MKQTASFLPNSLVSLLLIILAACRPTPSPTATPIVALATSLPTPTPVETAPTVSPTVMSWPTDPSPPASPPTLQPSSPTDRPTTPPTPSPTATAVPIVPEPFPATPLPLSAFPRPPQDNGLGVHWSTNLYGQSDAATDYFVSELAAMNIRWVKLLVDGASGHHYDRTIDQLVARGIMPVLRLYQTCNNPYNAAELESLVRHYTAKGVYYYELYNEPNQAGESGGWCDDPEPNPAYLARVWADAARTIYLAGGYPSLPSFFAPSQQLDGWQDDFFYRFFAALQEQGNSYVLYFSWAAIHNYHLNHPPTYPYDPANLDGRPLTAAEIQRYGLSDSQVAAINDARRIARQPGGFFLGGTLYDDTSNFFHFIAYRDQFYDLFGFEIPMISTEGGATRDSAEDPRYPKVDGRIVADWTLWSADYMLDQAPDYYFTTMTWLLAQSALDYPHQTWENNAWYHDRAGAQEPVVAALKNRPRKTEARSLCLDGYPDCPSTGPAERPTTPLDAARGAVFPAGSTPAPNALVDDFIAALPAEEIVWVRFPQPDRPELTQRYLSEQLVAAGIEPVMQLTGATGEHYDHLDRLMPAAVSAGVRYTILYEAPSQNWRGPGRVARLVDRWILAARTVEAAGGYPALPILPSHNPPDEQAWLSAFLTGIVARGQTRLLNDAWQPVPLPIE